MKKDEAEPTIRSLATKWLDTLPEDKREHPSFYAFKNRLSAASARSATIIHAF
jgi:hypothetical protein